MGSCLATYNKTQKPSVFACSVNAPKVCPQIFGPGDEILPPKTVYELFHNLRNYYVHTCSNIDLPFQHNKWRSSSKTYQPSQKAKIQSCRKCKRREMNPILFKKHPHHHNKWRKKQREERFLLLGSIPRKYHGHRRLAAGPRLEVGGCRRPLTPQYVCCFRWHWRRI